MNDDGSLSIMVLHLKSAFFTGRYNSMQMGMWNASEKIFSNVQSNVEVHVSSGKVSRKSYNE
jgi:hypothetical protein